MIEKIDVLIEKQVAPTEATNSRRKSCSDNCDNLISDGSKIRRRLKSQFEALYHGLITENDGPSATIPLGPELRIGPPKREQVRNSTKIMNNDKTSVEEMIFMISTHLMKAGDNNLAHILWRLMKQIWIREKVQNEM
jgi:hypothetical protein